MNSVKCVMATTNDVDVILDLEAQYEFEQYSRNNVLASLDDKNTITLLAFAGNICVGYLSALVVLDECNLLKIIVGSNYRKNGYAQALMQELIMILKEKSVSKIFLEVRKDNINAKNLYEKIGFIKNGERKNYYNNVDAELYWYNII